MNKSAPLLHIVGGKEDGVKSPFRHLGQLPLWRHTATTMANSDAINTLLDTADMEALIYLLTIAFHIGSLETSDEPSPIIENPKLAALIEVARRRSRHMPRRVQVEGYSDPPPWLKEPWE